MSLTIDLSSEVESRLKQEAERRGLDAGEYARQLIEGLLQVERREVIETGLETTTVVVATTM